MKIAVNNHENGKIEIYKFFKKYDSEQIEEILTTKYGYSLSNIDWFEFQEIIYK